MAGTDIGRLLSERGCVGSSVLGEMANMFGLSEDVVNELPIDRLKENSKHPFKVKEDEALETLTESIKSNGLIQPIIVRPIGDSYEILSGHRRTRAITKLGGRTIKAIVADVGDEDADRILIDTNFRQRSILLPSEIARSYKLRYDDLKRFRKNSDGRNFGAGKIDEILAEEFHCSKSSIYMYLHFLDLREELLELLDSKKIKHKIAEELSYLSFDEQGYVYELVFVEGLRTLDKGGAARLRAAHENQRLDKEAVMDILTRRSPERNTHIYFSKGELGRYLEKFRTPEDMEKAIIEFLESYTGKDEVK